jgi:predicted DCC family thiol-disulfide oxidoreductase YuxK
MEHDAKKNLAAGGPVLLYDGVCGLCNATVQRVLKFDKKGTMKFAALQSTFARSVLKRHPQLHGVDSIILIEQSPDTGEEQVFVRSAAALRVAAYLGGPWSLLRAVAIVPAPMRDFCYDLVAKYRYRIFGKYESCMLPSAEARFRFIDTD